MTTPVTEELPPRARRILNNRRQQFGNQGTTSACAENTWRCCWCERVWWNYLRVRGEYVNPLVLASLTMELPPRARRIPGTGAAPPPSLGTTSACAENTGRVGGFVSAGRNYLRVRGEYTVGIAVVRVSEELPPRARRIRLVALKEGADYGTTSACAENTAPDPPRCRGRRNYLRVRGEYKSTSPLIGKRRELPPRARRIRCKMTPIQIHIGTTSACAENTTTPKKHNSNNQNYLRVRGEYPDLGRGCQQQRELPPRARRIPLECTRHVGLFGTTSACAENTLRND